MRLRSELCLDDSSTIDDNLQFANECLPYSCLPVMCPHFVLRAGSPKDLDKLIIRDSMDA